MKNARYYAKDWISSSDETYAFARDMVRVGYIDDVDSLLEYMEKPWKWQREHAWWDEHGRTDHPDVWAQGEVDGFDL